MKNFVTATLIAVIVYVPSCSRMRADLHFGKSRRENDPGLMNPRQYHGSGQTPDGKTVYASGIDYPEGYDWVRDTACGRVNCKIVLFAGKERLRSIEAGPGQEVSPDPDMFRIRLGHIYTDYSTETETVIRKDGIELFRYPGRETLKGFLIVGDNIHTLGENRSGKGFTYRIDGKCILERKEGKIVGQMGNPAYEGGALYEDEGHVYFSYTGASLDKTELFVVKDGESSKVGIAEKTTEVFDCRIKDGKMYRIENRGEAVGNPYIICGESVKFCARYINGKRIALACRILRSGDNFLAGGYYNYDDSRILRALWDKNGIVETSFGTLGTYVTDSSRADVSTDDGGVSVVLDGEETRLYGSYKLFSPVCFSLSDQGFAIALSGPSPIVRYNETVFPLTLNGPLTEVRIE